VVTGPANASPLTIRRQVDDRSPNWIMRFRNSGARAGRPGQHAVVSGGLRMNPLSYHVDGSGGRHVIRSARPPYTTVPSYVQVGAALVVPSGRIGVTPA